MVAAELRRRETWATVEILVEYNNGLYLSLSDESLLENAAYSKIVFVTYDRAAMSATLHDWREKCDPHRGVVVVDDKTIPPSDVMGLVDRLQKLIELSLKWDWDNRVIYLHRRDQPFATFGGER